MTKILMLGDSITQGWDGSASATPMSTLIANKLGVDVQNAGIGGTQYYSKLNSFYSRLSQFNFADYSLITIMYGTNDFINENETLEQAKSTIDKAVITIRSQNKNAIVLFITPIQNFYFNMDMDYKNGKGWSQNEFDNMVIDEAKGLNVNYYDWRAKPVVTVNNFMNTLGDQEIHPNEATYQIMANQLSDVIKSLLAGISVNTGSSSTGNKPTDSGSTNTGSSGTTTTKPTIEPIVFPSVKLKTLASDLIQAFVLINDAGEKLTNVINATYLIPERLTWEKLTFNFDGKYGRLFYLELHRVFDEAFRRIKTIRDGLNNAGIYELPNWTPWTLSEMGTPVGLLFNNEFLKTINGTFTAFNDFYVKVLTQLSKKG